MNPEQMHEFIVDVIRQNAKTDVIGEVVKVYERPTADSDSNIEVDVQTRGLGNQFRRVPCALSDHTGHTSVPREGDFVIVSFLRSEGNAPIVTRVVHTNKTRAPLAREGHWRHEFRRDGTDNLYLEAEPADGSGGAPEVVRMGVKQDGVSSPSTEVSIDDSGSSTQINIATDGDINLSADGNIVIDQGGTPKRVLTEDAVFEYDDTTISDTSDGTGTSSTSTKQTTTVVNGETTSTRIE